MGRLQLILFLLLFSDLTCVSRCVQRRSREDHEFLQIPVKDLSLDQLHLLKVSYPLFLLLCIHSVLVCCFSSVLSTSVSFPVRESCAQVILTDLNVLTNNSQQQNAV